MLTLPILLTSLLLLEPFVDSADFPRDKQLAALRATVRIINSTDHSEGTAVLIKQGQPFTFLLTANHVVAGTEKVEIQLFKPEESKPFAVYRSAEIIARSPNDDLALLRLATTDKMPGTLAICPPKQVPLGRNLAVLTVGCSDGLAPSCLTDTIKEKKLIHRPDSEPTLVWQLTNEPAKGRSGGPVLDKNGLVLGICSGRDSKNGYYCHTERIHQFLKANGLRWLYEE